ncbi:hypothetical protein HPP92_024096 [Vanilla planifolia]|uniref:Exopolygalacturonase n=1 Tax=Vanilla planifolia TaxID=51239 RepID=A0A835UCM1_VANPL|nr:hypothetical protein HPP92_024096 [Vanilla planifolia]
MLRCVLLFLLFLHLPSITTTAASPTTTTFNIVDFGAKADGKTDSAHPLLTAWSRACASRGSGTVIVPHGTFLLSKALLLGPCNNHNMLVDIQGTVVAPASYTPALAWIMLKLVDGVKVTGGKLDGFGQALWRCKLAGKSCPVGATSLAVAGSRNVWINGLSSMNSELFHISIYQSSGVRVTGARITAPMDSPNTDGIHIQESSFVTVFGAAVGTGDDCISVGPGGSHIWIEHIKCGPGHGISIGSLGWEASEHGVWNVTARDVEFAGTLNGFRIKSWAKPSNGFARDIVFEDGLMNNVKYPIIIDQNYCPAQNNCPSQTSGVKISNVKFRNVNGTSATQVAVKLDCSKRWPCVGIHLEDVRLRYNGNGRTVATCNNVHGGSAGVVAPPSCISS